MARIVLFVIAFVFLVTGTTFAKEDHTFQTGKLINVTYDERAERRGPVRDAIFTVQIGDLTYTARGGHIAPNSGDTAQGLIIGDPVQAAIDNGDLFLLKPNGKEIKAKIIRRERTQQP